MVTGGHIALAEGGQFTLVFGGQFERFFQQDIDAHRTIDRESLLEQGFVFAYMTQSFVIEGITFRCCFDMCWYAHTDDSVAITRIAL